MPAVEPQMIGRVLLASDTSDASDFSGTASQSTAAQGTLEAVGPKAPEDLRPGTRVLFRRFAGVAAPLTGPTEPRRLIMDAADILATVPGTA